MEGIAAASTGAGAACQELAATELAAATDGPATGSLSIPEWISFWEAS